uniref:Uncharacterized protein n=1 Tax=Leptobrachium leishanense TaxID=445787 RepID=A0A8C5LPA0_9ANUR
MATPRLLIKPRIVKKWSKKFIRHQSDRCVKNQAKLAQTQRYRQQKPEKLLWNERPSSPSKSPTNARLRCEENE